MSLLRLQNVGFSFPRREEENFKIESLDFTINSPGFISIMGPNGSGKSTLLKLISGYLKPAEGSVQLLDKSLQDYTQRDLGRLIAFVPQIITPSFPYSVEEIIMMGRNVRTNLFGFAADADETLIEKLLTLFDLDDKRKKGINEISGGELQRTFLARAFAQEPKILLLDEPSAHLDIKHQITIFSKLEEYRNENDLTVISVLHDFNLAAAFSDRTVFMKNGKIVRDGNSGQVLSEKDISEIFGVNVELIENGEGNQRGILVKTEVDKC